MLKKSAATPIVFTAGIFTILLLLPALPANAATINATGCSYAAVSAAVNQADYGDTVSVPAGSCIWNDTLLITKAIILRGTGAGSNNVCDPGTETCVTSAFEAAGKTPGYSFIRYRPDSASHQPSRVFRLTGFWFDAANYTSVFRINAIFGSSFAQVRVDNNRFINCARPPDGPTSESWDTRESQTMHLSGSYKGVFHDNYFSGKPVFTISRSQDAWKSSIIPLWDNGDDRNIFFEDNYFDHGDYYNQVLASGSGGTYVVRYNVFDYSARNGAYYYAMDTHGAQEWSYAGGGAEVYGNKFIGAGQQGVFRGGIHKVFYNHMQGQAGTIVLHETYGTFYSKVTTPYICPVTSLYANEPNWCSHDGRAQNVEKSYFWNNRYSTSGPGGHVTYDVRLGGGVYPDPAVSGAWPLRENVEYWLPQSSFNGAVGVGCGTTLPANCTAGTAYWKTSQSCAEVPASSVGKNPTAPISGTLYRCTSANNWQIFYTPYTYPHPLRGGTTPPVCPYCCPAGSICSQAASGTCSSGTCCASQAACTSSTRSGDLNSDGSVNVIDLGIFLSNWGKTTKPPSDLNQNGIVDVVDLGILLGNWG